MPEKYLKEQIYEEEDLAVSIKIESFADADMGGLDSNKNKSKKLQQ